MDCFNPSFVENADILRKLGWEFERAPNQFSSSHVLRSRFPSSTGFGLVKFCSEASEVNEKNRSPVFFRLRSPRRRSLRDQPLKAASDRRRGESERGTPPLDDMGKKRN